MEAEREREREMGRTREIKGEGKREKTLILNASTSRQQFIGVPYQCQ